MYKNIRIIIDYREKPSGIPDLLMKNGMNVEMRELKDGDYFINNQILVERKTKEDFVQSLVSNRLFNQCQRIKKTGERPLIIIEGDPYKTEHKINSQAIKGALLSISVAWQIPLLLTSDKSETAEIIIMAARQMLHEKLPVIRIGYKPKKNRSKKLYFIQGLPTVGPVLAIRLLDEFKSIEKMMNTSEDELLNIEGIGKEKAKRIINFITK
jgi:Fanconi anemia group M protein